jgi:hypothetical protein
VTSRSGAVLRDVDPFDLPDWLASGPVVWESDGGLRASHHVTGTVTGEGGEHLPCALLAVDEAYPAPVAGDDVRTRAHQAWHHRQVLLVEQAGTLTLAVPGQAFDAELVLEALARFAKAVGASPDDYAALLTIGSARR